MTTRVMAVDRLDCRLVAYRWRFGETRADEIDRHWAESRRANPSLYDGRVLLACRVEERADASGARALSMDLFETRFSRFLAWRDLGFPDETIYNCFSMAAVRALNGGFLVGEMNRRHSSAGALYFPAGTPDPADIVDDGRVDLEGSLARELAEEAGLDARRGARAPGWTVVFDRQRIACMKVIDWPEPEAALLAQVKAFLAREENPELADAHLIGRRASLTDPRLPAFMTAFLGQALPGAD